MAVVRRRLVAAVLVAVALVAAPTSAAAADDPALLALRDDDAYVSPRVLGPAAAGEEAVLRSSARALRESGRPVKFALVLGPAGAPSLQVYAERLAARLAHDGTLVVTSARGGVAVVVPTPGRDVGPALRGAGVARIANPVERMVRAARLTAESVEPDDSGPAPVVILIGLALLGGGWAAAVGMGRQGRLDRRRLTESRAVMRLHLDTLRARASALARTPGLSDGDRARVVGALGTYAEVIPALQEARTPEGIDALAPRVREGLATLAAVAAGAGAPFAADRPFEGLCALDPAHGTAAEEPGDDGPAVCASCREAASEGRTPAPRLLPREGRPVPFDQVPLP